MSDLDQYDYQLPRELIAQKPLACRSDARLLLVDRDRQTIEHHYVRDLPKLLAPGDRLVLNDTRVVPAALMGFRTATGGAWQGLFLGEDQGVWQVLGKARGRLSPGESITLIDREGREAAHLRLVSKQPDGSWFALPDADEPALELLQRVGRVPLPHYIRGGQMIESDLKSYQTVFAKVPGAVAAPTAGLHFTKDLLKQLDEAGIGATYITLHVGLGTFRPLTADTLDAHRMHSEWACVSRTAAHEINRVRADAKRIVAVGTTCVRTLESAAAAGPIEPWSGLTELFIRPPYRFRAVDALLTNFHLPRTTLLVLVRTFGGDDLIRRAYEEAIREQYRFYSYGDAMLIV